MNDGAVNAGKSMIGRRDVGARIQVQRTGYGEQWVTQRRFLVFIDPILMLLSACQTFGDNDVSLWAYSQGR